MADLTANKRLISIDCETHDPFLNDRGPSWVYGEGEVLATGIHYVDSGKTKAVLGDGGSEVRKLLLSANVALIGANIQYDIGWLTYSLGIKMQDVKCSFLDVQVIESLIDEHQPFTLDQLARKYLKVGKQSFALEEVARKEKLTGNFRKHMKFFMDEGYEEEVLAYVASDADQPAKIWEKQKYIIELDGQWAALKMNMDMLFVTMKMKQRGMRIDYAKWVENCDRVGPIHDKLQTQFFEKWGEVNVNSPKQLGELLERLEIPYQYKINVRGFERQGEKFSVKKHLFVGDDVEKQRNYLRQHFKGVRIEKDRIVLYVDSRYVERTVEQIQEHGYNVTANPKVDKYFIKDYAGQYEVLRDLQEYKQVKNIMSKFLGEKFGRFIVYDKAKKEYRIHANFNVVGARTTGRMSGSVPNLQQIPSRVQLFVGTEDEVDLSTMCREIFLPEKGEVLVKLDFSGQENRLQAHFAIGKAGQYIRAQYTKNPRLDEHAFVTEASGLGAEFGASIGRKYAKNVRFGLSYGMQTLRMCAQFGWTKEFAERLSDRIKDAAPWMSETMDLVKAKVAKVGYVKTLIGRRLHLQRGNTSKTYQFYNYLIQGSASDQTKQCQVESDRTETVDSLLLSVHDEGDYSLPMDDRGLQRLKELIKIYQEHVKNIDVPMVCDPEIGPDWAHMEGLLLWDEDDLKEGRCKSEEVGYPKESIDEFWDRVITQIKGGHKVKERVFDTLEEGDDDEE